MLKINGVSKQFKNKVVLKDISLEIKAGTIVGLLGPNGAGKTTLMRIITGFYQPNTGEIYWNNKIADTRDTKYKYNLGYLAENNPLYIQMTAGEYLRFVAEMKIDKKVEIKDEILKVAKECGLSQVLGQKIDTLSKGYRQRVGLAATLISDPKLLILDEPTSGLDPNQIIEVRNLIKSLAKNKTVIFSTHILPEAKNLCDRLIIINQGKIVLDSETDKIKNLEKKFIELTNL